MDPLLILEKVNAFYSNAFSQLITLTLGIIGFSGIILPIILSIIQSRSSRIERKAFEAGILEATNKAKDELKKEFEKLFQIEKDIMQKHLEKEIDKAKAIGLSEQASRSFNSEKYVQATLDYMTVTDLLLSADDELNGQRFLSYLIDSCFPKLNSKNFAEDDNLDTGITKLIEVLKGRNDHGRYSDDITKINKVVKNSKKKSVETVKQAAAKQ